MLVFLILLTIGTVSFAIPRRYMKGYFILSAVVISALFFFYIPPESDDLFRYYSLFDLVEHINFSEYFHGKYGTDNWLWNYMLNDYKANAGTFSFLLFFVSRTGIKQLLTFTCSMLTYLPLFMLVWEICSKEKKSKSTLCMCFIIILACIDFRFVSCLRNLSAYALFTYVLYQDLVMKKKTLWCFIVYFILCRLHMACVVMLAMRVVVLLFNNRFRWIIVGVLTLTQSLSGLMVFILNTFFFQVPLLQKLSEKIKVYFILRTGYNVKGSLFFIGSIGMVILLYLFVKKSGIISEKYKKYETIFLYMTAFTVGSIGQYDVLMRNCELIVMMGLPFIAIWFNEKLVVQDRSIKLVSLNRAEEIQSVIAMLACVGLIALSVIFYTLFSYLPMDSGFFIG